MTMDTTTRGTISAEYDYEKEAKEHLEAAKISAKGNEVGWVIAKSAAAIVASLSDIASELRKMRRSKVD
jgi:hypothetical protein